MTNDAEIKQYWDERAATLSDTPAATTHDVHLRELEIATLTRELDLLGLRDGATVVDLGCGDGYSTVNVVERLPALRMIGIDYSPRMIESAERRLAATSFAGRVEFRVGDATDLPTALSGVTPAAVITDRVLINLTSFDAQRRVMEQIADALEPGGTYLAIENFMSGQEELNRARATVGLPAISVRWHNLYFDDDEFRQAAESVFATVRLDEFASSYYFATRVVYSAMCAMRSEEPDYDHEIHRLATRLPPFGNFSPIRLAVMRK
jgi:ubiquinone/menaquinone biosynthesis C-methylase UbiE